MSSNEKPKSRRASAWGVKPILKDKRQSDKDGADQKQNWVQEAEYLKKGAGYIEVLWTKKDVGVMPNVRRPSAKGGHSAFVMHPKDSRIFVFGGACGDQFLNEFYSLNINTLKWQSVHTYYPPRGRAYHSLVIAAPEQKKLSRGAVPVLIVYGGYNRGDCLSDMPILEEWGVMKRGPNPAAKLEIPAHLRSKDPPDGLQEDIWGTVIPQGEVPVGRCNHCCGALPGGRQMLVFGGWNTTFVDHCYLLNTDTWRWALKAVKDDKGVMPAPRASAASCQMRKGSWMLIHGGQDPYGQRQDMWVLDMVKLQWIQVKPNGRIPTARSGHTLTYVPEYEMVVLFGGWTGASMSNEVHIMSVAGDPKKDWRWQQLKVGGDQVKGRAGHTMTMAGDMLWVIGGITTGGETLDEVLTITLGFARYNFDFVHEEEVPPEQTTTDGVAKKGKEMTEMEMRAEMLKRKLQSEKMQAKKEEEQQEMWQKQAKEQQVNMLQRKVMDRAMAAGATYEEALMVAEGTASDELMERIVANAAAIREGRLSNVPPPPAAEEPPPKPARKLQTGMSSKASRRTEPQDDLDAILMTGGVAEGVGIDEHEGEDLDMRRLRIENTNAMGKPQSNAISFRPKRRVRQAVDYVPLLEGVEEGGERDGEIEAANGDRVGAPEPAEGTGGLANPEWLTIAAGGDAVDGNHMLPAKETGDAMDNMSMITRRAAQLVKERWKQHKARKVQKAAMAVIKIQAWIRGFRVRQDLRARGIQLPNNWLKAAAERTRREKEYKEDLARAHRERSKKA